MVGAVCKRKGVCVELQLLVGAKVFAWPPTSISTQIKQQGGVVLSFCGLNQLAVTSLLCSLYSRVFYLKVYTAYYQRAKV